VETAALNPGLDRKEGASGLPARGLLGLSGAAYRLAMRILGSPEDAEDVVQQAYVAALERLRSGSPPLEERAWFLGAVANLARLHRRRQSKRREKEAAMRQDRAGAPAQGTDFGTTLGGAMAMLDEKYRLPVSLYYEEGLTQRETAAILKLPESTISDHVNTGLVKLRKALERAGYPAAVAAVLGGLKSTAPDVPASLAGRVEALVANGAVGQVAMSGSAVSAAAAKGGIAMKLIAGLVLAGAVAAGVATLSGGGGGTPLPAGATPVKGPLKREHFAFINQYGHLDGPRREAIAGRGPRIALDAKGNAYFFAAHYYGALRCVRTGGQVVSLSGNDYWNSDMPLTEGPASCLGNPYGVRGMSFGLPTGTLVVKGVPDEGADKGCIYTTDPYKNVVRVFRNKEKNNRWWFERIAGGGKTPAPQKRGQSAVAKEVAFRYMPRLQHDRNGKLVIFVDGAFYHCEAGKLVCLLGPADYKDKGIKLKKGPPTPAEGFLAGDGSFYLGYYYSGAGEASERAAIWRVSPDGARVEPYVRDVKHGLNMKDGPALKAEFACGPHLRPMINSPLMHPPDILIVSAHDEYALRRVKDGRVATLCKDGEWREFSKKPVLLKQSAPWFRNWTPGPNGTAYLVYSGHKDVRTWLISGIDWGKPTVGPKAGGGE